MFNTKLIDKFYEALFSTDFKDYASATQNAKTDYLFDCKNLEEWFDKLVNVFADEEGIDATTVKVEALADKKFMDTLQSEYSELLDLLADDEE